MSDPAYALQRAIVAALKGADTEAEEDVFDAVPSQDPFPRITIENMQTIGNYADCYEGSEVFFEINVWSRPSAEATPAIGTVGFQQVQRIASDIRAALHDAELSLDGHTLELLEFQDAQYLRDPDGMTRRARITLRALTQPTDSGT